VLGEPIDDVVGPPDGAEARAINRRVRDVERVAATVRRRTAEGYLEVRLLSVPLRPGEAGEPSYAVYRPVGDWASENVLERPAADDSGAE
jgi:hypothetical protein